MNENPLVSVIMPVYNGATTISNAIKSLFLQTYYNWECIIVDDGSVDETKSIIGNLGDKRIKFFLLERNYGRGFARQYALERVQGKYITYLDADDFFHPLKIENQVKFLEKNEDIDLVSCFVTVFNDDFKAYSSRGISSLQKEKYIFGKNLPLVMPTAMIRTDKALSYEYNSSLNASEDVDFFSRYLDNCYYFVLPESLMFYFVAENTSKNKIVEYYNSEVKRGLLVYQKTKYYGGVIIVKTLIKKMIVLGFSIFLGINFFLKRRGQQIASDRIIEFETVLERLRQ